MYKHILVTTDGSDFALKGVKHAIELARSLGAEVTIVTVTEGWSPLVLARQAEHGAQNVVETFEQAAEDEAGAILDAAMKATRTDGVTVKTRHIPDSHPAEGIVRAATEEGCDLIVIASHGRRGASRLILGSQAAEVLARTSVPVLVIR